MTEIPDLETTIRATALYSLFFAAYFNSFLLILGTALIRPYLEFCSTAWKLVLCWLAGFWVSCTVIVVLGICQSINLPALIYSHVVCWLVVLLRIKVVWVALGSDFQKANRLAKQDLANFNWLPLLLLSVVAVLASLSPPTKIDAITYHIYYPKELLRLGGISLIYSPYEILVSSLAVQTCWVWFFAAGAEYSPAITSAAIYIASWMMLYVWGARQVGKPAARCAVLVAAATTTKIVCAPAPEDVTLSFLLALMILAAAIEVSQLAQKPGGEGSSARKWFILLHYLAALGFIVKSTSALLSAPLLLALYLTSLKRRFLTVRTLGLAALSIGIVAPFFIRNVALYSNPIFPVATQLFGSGPFDAEQLQLSIRGHSEHPEISRNAFGFFIKAPLHYLGGKLLFLNALYWILFGFGLFHCVRRKQFCAIIGFAASYTLAFFLLPFYYPRFYAGLLDGLVVYGTYELCLIGSRWKQDFGLKFMHSMTAISAWVMFAGGVYFSWQFISPLVTGISKEEYLRPRVESLSTIQWINSNLPNSSKVLVSTRGRYYYNVATASTDPTVLGKPKSILSDHSKLYEHLQESGVTHVMSARRNSAQSSAPTKLERFLSNDQYVSEVFKREDETVLGFRWSNNVLGTTTVYQLRE